MRLGFIDEYLIVRSRLGTVRRFGGVSRETSTEPQARLDESARAGDARQRINFLALWGVRTAAGMFHVKHRQSWVRQLPEVGTAGIGSRVVLPGMVVLD